MDELHQGLIAALNAQENTMPQKESINLVNQTEVYWFFQELNKLISGESSLKRMLNLIRNGQDAVWCVDYPFPFLVLNFVQIPWLLLNATVNGTVWSTINFCLRQVL